MRRVAVIGASCSAKTTLARELAARLDLPHVQLDALHHGPGWTEATAEERQASVEAALAQHADGWVVDGNYERQIGDLVVGKADTVIWLDLPLALILWRLTRRTAGRVVRRTELWNGNRETLRNALLAGVSLRLDDRFARTPPPAPAGPAGPDRRRRRAPAIAWGGRAVACQHAEQGRRRPAGQLTFRVAC